MRGRILVDAISRWKGQAFLVVWESNSKLLSSKKIQPLLLLLLTKKLAKQQSKYLEERNKLSFHGSISLITNEFAHTLIFLELWRWAVWNKVPLMSHLKWRFEWFIPNICTPIRDFLHIFLHWQPHILSLSKSVPFCQCWILAFLWNRNKFDLEVAGTWTDTTSCSSSWDS